MALSNIWRLRSAVPIRFLVGVATPAEISALFGLETLSSVKRMGSQGLSEFGLIDQKLNNGTLLNNW
ncbi:hypothetical protein PKF023_06360 [Polynucleobacter yangtzensis]|jgi:hypothetical protein|uniref:Uncharacterized protein n=1 Tax=Polynucleobacter yangtzensis TaxID=1743159 RepID=A0A9C7FJQ6_9BURK|nr:hypothetical protein PKF023_06360 [Polynucleobacter yangtzensis]BDT78686.1 hypothetical protein PKF032_05740 [Polynucleobacter yangtzensis]